MAGSWVDIFTAATSVSVNVFNLNTSQVIYTGPVNSNQTYHFADPESSAELTLSIAANGQATLSADVEWPANTPYEASFLPDLDLTPGYRLINLTIGAGATSGSCSGNYSEGRIDFDTLSPVSPDPAILTGTVADPVEMAMSVDNTAS